MRFKGSAVNFKMAEENGRIAGKGKMFYVVIFPIFAHQNILQISFNGLIIRFLIELRDKEDFNKVKWQKKYSEVLRIDTVHATSINTSSVPYCGFAVVSSFNSLRHNVTYKSNSPSANWMKESIKISERYYTSNTSTLTFPFRPMELRCI